MSVPPRATRPTLPDLDDAAAPPRPSVFGSTRHDGAARGSAGLPTSAGPKESDMIVGVIGSGAIGPDLAYGFLTALSRDPGSKVFLVDIKQEALDAGVARIQG